MPHWTLIANKHETTLESAVPETLLINQLNDRVSYLESQIANLYAKLNDAGEKDPAPKDPNSVSYVNPVGGNVVRFGTGFHDD